jgi:hypothetical protein
MSKIPNLLLVLALATATSAAFAQNDDQQSEQLSNPPMQSQPAPIERSGDNFNGANAYPVQLTAGQVLSAHRGSASAIAGPGVFVRIGHGSAIRAIRLSNENTELRVERGVANISVHSAIKHAQILIDLPGGQTNLIKDGFYTFNASTNTIRTLKGEAYAYPGTGNMQAKPIKVKENHAVVFNGPDIRSFEFDPFEARADLIPYAQGGMGGQAEGPEYYGPYAGYPYYDYGYPYYFGYGYPGFYDPFYFGFGWGGGYYGGYRGGWGGGRGGWGGGRGGWGGGRGGGGFGGGHGGGGRH